MRHLRFPSLSVALGATVLVVVGFSDPAASALPCAYDAGTKSVTASLDAGDSAVLQVDASGEILFGASPSPCEGATTANTDDVLVTGPAGSTEHLVVDQSMGLLAPGATPEDLGRSEIEVRLELGDASDEVVVRGSPDEVPLAVGTKGVAVNDDTDVDVTFSPLPASIELVAADGVAHVVSARGGFGSGGFFPGPVTLRAGNMGDFLTGSDFADRLVGGDGADLIHGSSGGDVIDGGKGNDKLRGVGGDDSVTGGPGADILAGSSGDDLLEAHDGTADLRLSGGPGVDTARYDRGRDPRPQAVETLMPFDPPPDPGTTCDFAGGVVSATIAPGGRATLKVSGGAIRFGAPVADCDGATTTNTERITVSGAAGSRETLAIDLRGGRLAPGASPEARGRSEIEVALDLGDAMDIVRVVGPHTGAFVAVGLRGLALNADGDLDVRVQTAPATVALVGGRGRDRLGAAGGYGTGKGFAGSVEVHGAGAADVLVGGNGRDAIWGGPGSDLIVGGGRPDALSGGAGNDDLRAVDRLRDRRVDGDAGWDVASFDRGRDQPVECELVRPRSG